MKTISLFLILSAFSMQMISAQNAPLTSVPLITTNPGSGVSVQVKVNSFTTIGAVSLTLKYNPAVLTYLSAENTSAFPNLSINSPEDGTIIIGGYSLSADGESYDDNTTLFTLNFTYQGGTTGLNWFDDGGSCEYAGPLGSPVLNDSPQPTYYQDGSVSPSPSRHLNLKAFLEGPYDPVSGLMSTLLNTGSFIPNEQPYNTAPWNYAGTEQVATIPDGVVDWVLVELRDAYTAGDALPATKLPGWPRAFFLKSNGSVVALDGTSPPEIGNSPVYHNLFVIIRHRNHIGVMSSGSMTLTGADYSYDFTSNRAQAYGSNQKQIAAGISALYGGDVNLDGSIGVLDMGLVDNQSAIFASGYLQEDINGDGSVGILDMGIIDNNSSNFVSERIP